MKTDTALDVVTAADAEMDARPLGWLRGAPPAARRGLLAATLGWMLDSFDVFLYSLVLTAILRDFRIPTTVGGLLGSLTLVTSAVGGVIFGNIADRHGRRTAMIGSILVYSVFTAACGLAQGIWQLAICRTLLGLGMGGEWTSGVVLVSESWPDRHRGKALGLMQSGWALGYAAAIVSAYVLPRYGWRATFFVGLLPALLTVWVRRGVEEPEIWRRTRAAGAPRRGSLAEIFRGDLRRSTIAITMLSTFTLFAYWGLNFWIPAYFALPPPQHGFGFSPASVARLVVTMQAGTWVGYVTYGYVNDALGRRRSFALYLIAAAVLVAIYGSVTNPRVLFLLGPFVAFFGTGYFSGFGAIAAEIYPTSIRATAQGFTFNTGRIGSAVAPFLVASVAASHGFGVAFWMTAAAFLLAAVTLIWIPETRGRVLE
jgi:MFS family permease